MHRSPPPDARARARLLTDTLAAAPAARRPADARLAETAGAPWSAVREPRPIASSEPDAEPERSSEPGAEADLADVSARFRAGALGAVSTAYAAAHGHPVGTELDEPAGARRWAVTARAATLVLAVVLAVGSAVVTVAVSRGAGAPTGRLGAAVDVPTPRASARSAAPAPAPTPVPSSGSGAGGGAGEVATGGAATAAPILVHVVGEVRRPGLVHLAAGSRLEDAVEAAGGATKSAELDAVNLAAVVTDGEQVRIPAHGEAGGVTGAASGSAGTGSAGTGSTGTGSTGTAAAAPLDLNAADAAALDALPGIGPVLAQRIVDHRTQSGPFTSVDQLDEVAGIGATLLARLRELVRV